MSERKFILAIETAVRGGSLSLSDGVAELDGWTGAREVSKSEDVLAEIKRILERRAVQKSRLKSIVVSRGPGSYTGMRIGMAIGLGLRKALGCELFGASALEAMMAAIENGGQSIGEEIIAALPIGRNQIVWQNLSADRRIAAASYNQPQFSTVDGFFDFCEKSKRKFEKIILHHKLYRDFTEVYANRLTENFTLIDAGENVAAFIGRAKVDCRDIQTLRPIYILNN